MSEQDVVPAAKRFAAEVRREYGVDGPCMGEGLDGSTWWKTPELATAYSELTAAIARFERSQ